MKGRLQKSWCCNKKNRQHLSHSYVKRPEWSFNTFSPLSYMSNDDEVYDYDDDYDEVDYIVVFSSSSSSSLSYLYSYSSSTTSSATTSIATIALP